MHVLSVIYLIFLCSDPCYGTLTRGSVISADFMSRDPGNPCRGLQDKTCKLDFGKNLNFNDLQRNRFNISCQCAKEREGFQWNSQYHLCVGMNTHARTHLHIKNLFTRSFMHALA